MKYYTVYKITNNISGKYYIGVHITGDLDDSYMGSGVVIKRAIAKYGLENFTKEYLCIFDNQEEMFAMESILVCESEISNPLCYNLVFGGKNGIVEHNADPEWRWARQKGRTEANRNMAKSDGWTEKLSKAQKARHAKNPIKVPPQFDWTGKPRSDETKRKIGEANKVMTGERNSQYGTVWLYNEVLDQNKKVKKEDIEDFLLTGWKKGRKFNPKPK